MRLAPFVAVPGALFLIAACIGEDQAADGGIVTPTGDGGLGGPDSGTDAAVLGAVAKPKGLVFRDGDIRKGFLAGEVKVERAPDESALTEYRVYFGSSDTKKLLPTPLGTAKVTGSDPALKVPDDTPAPEAATHLLAYAVGTDDRESDPVAIPFADNTVTSKLLEADGATYTSAITFNMDVLFEPQNKKVIVSPGTPSLVFCDPSFNNCTSKATPPSPPASSGGAASPHIDPTNKRIVFARADYSTGAYLAGLTLCDLDGSNCVMKNASGGAPGNSGFEPTMVLDPAKDQIVIASSDSSANSRLHMTTCNMNGDGCTYRDGDATNPDTFGSVPQVMVDAANDKILVMSLDTASPAHLYFHSCTRAGASCDRRFIPGSFSRLVSIFDEASGQALSIVRDDTAGRDGRIGLVRCTGASPTCLVTDASAGRPANSSINSPGLALYAPSKVLFIASISGEAGNNFRLGLYRCPTDGSACTHRWLSGTDRTYNQPAIHIDADGVMRVVCRDSLKNITTYVLNAW